MIQGKINTQDPLCHRWVKTKVHYDKEIKLWQQPMGVPGKLGDQLCVCLLLWYEMLHRRLPTEQFPMIISFTIQRKKQVKDGQGFSLRRSSCKPCCQYRFSILDPDQSSDISLPQVPVHGKVMWIMMLKAVGYDSPGYSMRRGI